MASSTFSELLRGLGLAVGNGGVALAVGALQLDAAQPEVAQRHLDDAAAHRRPGGEVRRGGQALVLLYRPSCRPTQVENSVTSGNAAL